MRLHQIRNSCLQDLVWDLLQTLLNFGEYPTLDELCIHFVRLNSCSHDIVHFLWLIVLNFNAYNVKKFLKYIKASSSLGLSKLLLLLFSFIVSFSFAFYAILFQLEKLLKLGNVGVRHLLQFEIFLLKLFVFKITISYLILQMFLLMYLKAPFSVFYYLCTYNTMAMYITEIIYWTYSKNLCLANDVKVHSNFLTDNSLLQTDYIAPHYKKMQYY